MFNRQRHEALIDSLKGENKTFTARKISVGASELWLLYVRQLVDVNALSQFVLKPIMEHYESALVRPRANKVAESVISAVDCWVESNLNEVENIVLKGMAVLLFDHDERYVVVNLKDVPHRGIHTPDFTYSIIGPKDCFVENLDVNLSLIRYRLKDPKLKIDMLELGRRSRTGFAVIYIEDIANVQMVSDVKARLGSIDTDGIWGTGEVQGFLSNTKHDLFQQSRLTERSDAACEAILEGKVVLLGDGGHAAAILPTTFNESLLSSDDRYGNKFFGLFAGIIRYAAVLITLCATSIYVALVSYHPDALPSNYAILLTNLRQNVLFPATLEVLIVELILELVREALLRVPSKIGTAIGIVGAIVIGDAASAAGIFDSLVLILVASSLLASFAMPDYFSMNPLRILKFFVIIMTGLMGFYGFVLAMSLILTNLVSIDSFGVPFFAPFAPHNRYDFKRAFIFTRSTSSLRMQYMRTNDDTRSSYAHENLKQKPEKDGKKNQDE